MDEEEWITFYDASHEVEQTFGISRAAAQKRLRQACADQLITSKKAPYEKDAGLFPIEFWSPVAPGEWRQREVDYDGPDKDRCEIAVMLRETDYRYWLKQQCAPQSDRDAAIAKRLSKHIPGRDMPWKRFCDDIRKDCGASPTTRGFSDETIENITRQLMKVHS
jgi:hypothetical protein